MARSSALASLFGRSPFKPMQEHIGVATQCAAQVPELFEALAAGDQDRVVSIKDRIYELEQQADDIKNELRAHLPKSLLLPVDRRDLLEVLDMQDSIADTAQDIAGLLFERPMEVPENLKDPLLALTRRCVDACNQAVLIIGELDELVETGFRGRESDRVSEMVAELNKIETDTDEMGTELVRRHCACCWRAESRTAEGRVLDGYHCSIRYRIGCFGRNLRPLHDLGHRRQ
jgi:predicted phosphate transport protein (TIGR00153 family)